MTSKEMQMIDADGETLLPPYVQKYMKKIKSGSK